MFRLLFIVTFTTLRVKSQEKVGSSIKLLHIINCRVTHVKDYTCRKKNNNSITINSKFKAISIECLNIGLRLKDTNFTA